MLNNPAQVKEKLDKLAPNIGMNLSDRKRMINTELFLFGLFVIDIFAFEDWMLKNYPRCCATSIAQFIENKDPEHLNEWKEILGVF